MQEGLSIHLGLVVSDIHIGEEVCTRLVEIKETLHKETVIALLQPMQRQGRPLQGEICSHTTHFGVSSAYNKNNSNSVNEAIHWHKWHLTLSTGMMRSHFHTWGLCPPISTWESFIVWLISSSWSFPSHCGIMGNVSLLFLSKRKIWPRITK